jgi:hypothetical protein
LPYHYGGWDLVPGRGWLWFPGNLRTWSPHQVTWFNGPNWVGWAPRPHQKDGAIACDNNCGGGVVSISTFRHGGLLTSNLMLGFNPTVGVKVKEPGILPTMAAKLTGPAVSARAAWPGKSTIVYDPQQNRYVNSNREVTPQKPPTSPTAASATTTPAVNSGLVQPVPVGSREQDGRSVENQGFGQPDPAMGANTARPAPSAPRGETNTYAAPANHGNASGKPGPSGSYGNSSVGRVSGAPSGGSHVGGSGGTVGAHH